MSENNEVERLDEQVRRSIKPGTEVSAEHPNIAFAGGTEMFRSPNEERAFSIAVVLNLWPEIKAVLEAVDENDRHPPAPGTGELDTTEPLLALRAAIRRELGEGGGCGD